MGIAEKDVRLLGELDDICTVASDFCISPFVGLIPYPYPFKMNRQEIEEVLEVPLVGIPGWRPNFGKKFRERNGEPLQVYFFQHEDHTIWGATARILKQLIDLLPEEDKANLKPKVDER